MQICCMNPVIKMIRLLLIGGFILATADSYAQKKTGALHCLGNGNYAVFQEGMDVKSLFGN